jgi:hypothetical protein
MSVHYEIDMEFLDCNCDYMPLLEFFNCYSESVSYFAHFPYYPLLLLLMPTCNSLSHLSGLDMRLIIMQQLASVHHDWLTARFFTSQLVSRFFVFVRAITLSPIGIGLVIDINYYRTASSFVITQLAFFCDLSLHFAWTHDRDDHVCSSYFRFLVI